MPQPTELEKIVAEFDDSPAHILGLNGWLLRTLPKESRLDFLKHFARDIKLAYHPDKTTDAKEKDRRWKFIGAVTNAVSYLTSSEMAYELAMEEVPSGANPIVRLKERISAGELNIAQLESRIRELNQNNSALSSSLGEMRKAKEAKDEEILGMRRNECFIRLNDYQNWYVRNAKVVPINSNDSLLIFGRKMSASRTVNNEEKTKTIRITSLLDLARKEYPSYDERDADFIRVVEEDLISQHGQYFLFNDGNTFTKKGESQLLGSLPSLALKEFLNFRGIGLNPSGEVLGREFNLGSNYSRILFHGDAQSEAHKYYSEHISQFLQPYVSESVPALIRHFVRAGQKVRYELLYVQGVERVPRGTELDLWFMPRSN